jgi:autotransporter-associated beta strand protein
MNSHLTRAVLAVLVLALAAGPAAAQSTWTGVNNGTWSTTNNWSGGFPVSGANTTLAFSANNFNPLMTNDLAGTFVLNSMTFNAGAPAYTLGGNPLNFQANSGGAFPSLIQNSSNAVTFNNSIGINNGSNGLGGLNVEGSGSGTVTFNGAITGSGALIVDLPAAGTVVLGSGANTYSGTGFTAATFVYGGTLLLGNGFAIPTGTTVLVKSGGTFSTGGLSNNAAAAIGTLYLGYTSSFTFDGGTFRVPSGSGNYYLNKLNMTNGAVDFTGANNSWLHFTGSGAGITTNASGTTAAWVGGGTSRIQNDTSAPLTITVGKGTTPSGVDLDAGIILSGGGTNPNFTLTGGGTMRLTNPANTATITVTAGTLRVDDAASNGGIGALGAGSIVLAGSGGTGVLAYGGATATSTKSITLGGPNGGAIQVLSGGTTLTLNGLISQSSGPAGLAVYGTGTGGGTLVLNANNLYAGGTGVYAGGVLAIPTIAIGGAVSPIGVSSSAPGNLALGSGSDSGTLLLTGTNTAYSTDRGITVAGSPFGGNPVTGGIIGVQNAATTLTVGGQITGSFSNSPNSGNLIKVGPGTLVLTNTTNNYAVSYAGGTYVQGGTLSVGAAGAVIPSGSNVTVSPGATFQVGFASGSNSAAPAGTVTLSGGTLQIPAGSPSYYLNQLVIGAADGTVDLSNSAGGLVFTGTNPTIVVNGNSTFTGGGGTIGSPFSAGTVTIAIAPNVTLTNSIPLGSAGSGYQVTGGGTLYVTTAHDNHLLPLAVLQGRVRVDDLSLTNGVTSVLGVPSPFTLNGGTLQYSGGNQTTAFPIALGPNGGAVEVSTPGTTLTLTGPIGGPAGAAFGPLVKSGSGTLTLNNTANTYVGGITVNAGVLSVSSDAQLGAAVVTVNPAGVLLYSASATTGRTFDLTGGTLWVPDLTTLTLGGATVNGGFLRSVGGGNFAVAANGAALYGVTVFNGTTVNQNSGPLFAQNLTFGGTHTVAAGQTFTLTAGNYTASSQLIVTGTANVTDFTTAGKTSVTGTGQLVNTGLSPLVFGGGSVTAVGGYNPTTGQVTQGGTISLGAQDMVVQGGFVRNNGRITSTTGNLVIDAGGVVRGSGTFDVNSIVQLNGGVRFTGNSPGLATVRNLDLTGGSVTGADMSNATGQGGSANPNGFSGWGVTEYGATTLTAGRLTVTATPANPALVKFNTVTDVAPRNAYQAPTNFNRALSYTWVVFRPGTTAGFAQSSGTVAAANQDDFNTQNTVAQISVTDSGTGTVYSHANGNLTAAVLNQYLKFDPSAGTPAGALGFVDPATGSAIQPSVGAFSFALGPDTLGNPDRVVLLVYTPVPEPVAVVTVAAAGLTVLMLVPLRRRGSKK